MNTSDSFLGTGWGFPPTFIKGKNTVETTVNQADIQSSLEILLSTGRGERFLQPTYGCDLRKLLFEPLDTSLKAYMKDLIKTAILYHEPRIKLDEIQLMDDPAQGLIEISLAYTIRSTNSRYNFVYPFYLNEGTNLSP